MKTALHEFRNFQGLISPATNKSESVQKNEPIGIVNNFKLINQNERNGLIKTPLKCKSVRLPHKNSLFKVPVSPATPRISRDKSK